MVSDGELSRWSVPHLQDWARRLTDQGWAVTPIRAFRDAQGSIKKRPIWTAWLQKGLLTDADIGSFTGLRMTHLALVLGPEHVGLDLDNKDGANLRDTYRRLSEAYGPLPRGPRQRTLTGGLHALQRIDPERVAKFSRKARLPCGEEVAVDVVRKGDLCLVLYDTAFPGLAPDSDEIPCLPDPWYGAIRSPVFLDGARGVGKAATGKHAGIQPVGSRVQAVAEAKVGSRNTTLLGRTREIVRDGRWTEEIEEAVVRAALAGGQDRTEVRGTVASAVRYGLKTVWGDCLTWLMGVQASGIHESSKAWDLACLLCSRIVAANRSCQEPFAISDREFAERMGIDTKSVRRRIKSLLDNGLLDRHASRTAFHLPTGYNLLTPDPTEGLLPSRSEDKNTRTPDREGGMGLYAAVERALGRVELGRHSAFQQIGDGPSLPRSGIRIVDALEENPEGLGSMSEIARRTGLDRGTVSRAVEALVDADLVVCEGQRVRLKSSDVMAALDEWCDLYDVPDRIALRRERHKRERADLDLYDRQNHRGRYGPRAVGGRVSFDPADWNAARTRQEEGLDDD